MAKKHKNERNQKVNTTVTIVDVLANTIGVFFLILIVLMFASRGIKVLEGWTLVAVIALLSAVTVIAIAAVWKRKVRAKVSKTSKEHTIEGEFE